MNIKIKVNLSAYSKGIIPDVSKFIEDAPADDKVYGRKNNEWYDVRDYIVDQQIAVESGSGLNLTKTEEGHPDLLSVRQAVVEYLPSELEDDTTYYQVEDIPELYIDGGTAYSDGGNDFTTGSEYRNIIEGGDSASVPTLALLSINAKGVLYNE